MSSLKSKLLMMLQWLLNMSSASLAPFSFLVSSFSLEWFHTKTLNLENSWMNQLDQVPTMWVDWKPSAACPEQMSTLLEQLHLVIGSFCLPTMQSPGKDGSFSQRQSSWFSINEIKNQTIWKPVKSMEPMCVDHQKVTTCNWRNKWHLLVWPAKVHQKPALEFPVEEKQMLRYDRMIESNQVQSKAWYLYLDCWCQVFINSRSQELAELSGKVPYEILIVTSDAWERI